MKQLQLYRYSFAAMGSPCEIQLYAPQQSAKAIAQKLMADIARLEQRYSRYRPDSYLSHINHHAAAGTTLTVDPETAHLLDYATTCYQQSDGLFDISAGGLRKAWHFSSGQTELPDAALISQLLATVGWDKVIWQAPQLRFSQPGMALDFGGIVKEYAADRTAALASQLGIRHGVVNLGGDIKVIGAHPDGSPWRIGIQAPDNPHAIIGAVELSAGGMASSGDYQRCITVDGKRFGHILNPKTGWPVQTFAAVSVISDFCVLAGSASTITMLKEAEGVSWLEALQLPYLWVKTTGEMGGCLIEP